VIIMSGYAVLQTGGRQYRVQPGDVLDVEKILGETGEQVELNDVLLINENDELLLGNPKIEGASVIALVQSQHRGPKIIVFKYKNKTHYRRKNGHRQDYTRLEIQEIRFGVENKRLNESESNGA
jgi:large subunit ribosomal protein L21